MNASLLSQELEWQRDNGNESDRANALLLTDLMPLFTYRSQWSALVSCARGYRYGVESYKVHRVYTPTPLLTALLERAP